MASAHSTSWAEADATSPNRDRALAVNRMVLGSVIRGALGIRATLPLGPGAWNRYDIQPIMAPRHSKPVQAGSRQGDRNGWQPDTRGDCSHRPESCAEDGPL